MVGLAAQVCTRTETSKPLCVVSSSGAVGYSPAYVIWGTMSVMAAAPTCTRETDFQIPLVKVGMPSCLVLVYGAQSQPPVQLIHRPPQSILGSKTTSKVCGACVELRVTGKMYLKNWSVVLPMFLPSRMMSAPILIPSKTNNVLPPPAGAVKVVEYVHVFVSQMEALSQLSSYSGSPTMPAASRSVIRSPGTLAGIEIFLPRVAGGDLTTPVRASTGR